MSYISQAYFLLKLLGSLRIWHASLNESKQKNLGSIIALNFFRLALITCHILPIWKTRHILPMSMTSRPKSQILVSQNLKFLQDWSLVAYCLFWKSYLISWIFSFKIAWSSFLFAFVEDSLTKRHFLQKIQDLRGRSMIVSIFFRLMSRLLTSLIPRLITYYGKSSLMSWVLELRMHDWSNSPSHKC